MAKKEFVQLAHEYKRERDCIAGWLVSEKLDGMRCYWDGGITRGLPKASVPWANNDKDSRLLNIQFSTGLWSRYGNVIHAPDTWLDHLPSCPLDGELYSTELSRQEIMSIIKKFAENHDPSEWEKVKYYCFDRPAYETIFANGIIKGTNYNKAFSNILVWLKQQPLWETITKPNPDTRFQSNYKLLVQALTCNEVAIAHEQTQLPWSTAKAEEVMDEMLESISEAGGEGLIVRNPGYNYICERAYSVLKVKKIADAEATVVGYTSGRETDKGSKLLGLMGALIVEAHGYVHENGITHKARFELSGFTDAERELGVIVRKDTDAPDASAAREWAIQNPGQVCPEWISNPNFPRGSVITFKYRGVSDDGIPQEARYYRKRENI